MSLRFAVVGLSLLLALSSALSADAARIASVFGGRVPCVEQAACSSAPAPSRRASRASTACRSTSNVTLPPAAMDGPFPLIVDLHGWSLGKTDGAVRRAGEGRLRRAGLLGARLPRLVRHRGVARAGRDARRTRTSASSAAGSVSPTRATRRATRSTWPACSSTRASSIPRQVGVTGASYGGGQSMMLAALKNRVMLPDGSLVPWTSPDGVPHDDRRRGAASSRGPTSRYSLVAERPHARLPRRQSVRPARRRAEAVVERGALRRRPRDRLLRARRRPIPTPTSDRLERAPRRGRAVRRRSRRLEAIIDRGHDPSTRPTTSTTPSRPRRSSSTTRGPTTSSRSTRRCASGARRAPSIRTPRSRSTSPTTSATRARPRRQHGARCRARIDDVLRAPPEGHAPSPLPGGRDVHAGLRRRDRRRTVHARRLGRAAPRRGPAARRDARGASTRPAATPRSRAASIRSNGGAVPHGAPRTTTRRRDVPSAGRARATATRSSARRP